MKAVHNLLALATTASAALTYKGVDWSSLLVQEAAGHTFTGLDGKEAPLETILAANGVNTVRQRLWVNPSNGDYDLDYNLKLAKRARAADLDLYLDLHFSDTWADPANQKIPSTWPTNVDDLAWQIYNYTLETSNAFASASIPISLLSIGNEITGGALFPVGKISQDGGAYNLARLLHSAAAGVKDSDLQPQPKLMLHLDNGWNLETQKWWYDLLLEQGPLVEGDFDVQGVSYYPFYNEEATLEALWASLGGLRERYGKEVMVVGESASFFKFLLFPLQFLSSVLKLWSEFPLSFFLAPSLFLFSRSRTLTNSTHRNELANLLPIPQIPLPSRHEGNPLLGGRTSAVDQSRRRGGWQLGPVLLGAGLGRQRGFGQQLRD